MQLGPKPHLERKEDRGRRMFSPLFGSEAAAKELLLAPPWLRDKPPSCPSFGLHRPKFGVNEELKGNLSQARQRFFCFRIFVMVGWQAWVETCPDPAPMGGECPSGPTLIPRTLESWKHGMGRGLGHP